MKTTVTQFVDSMEELIKAAKEAEEKDVEKYVQMALGIILFVSRTQQITQTTVDVYHRQINSLSKRHMEVF